MKIELKFTIVDVERVLAEHCRKQFRVDPKNVSVRKTEKCETYIAEVEGEYQVND